MAPGSTQPSVTVHKLVEVMTLEDEKQIIAYLPDGKREKNSYVNSICYFPNGKQMISGSSDKSIRRWDLQEGKEIGEARIICEQEVFAVAVSRDGRWIVAGGGDLSYDGPGELKASEVETGMVKTLQGHSRTVTCIDISMDNELVASGSTDSTARIWDLDTGELVAGPFECVDRSWVEAVRFSQDSKKLAVKSYGKCLEVWDLEAQKLDVRVGKPSGGVIPGAPVFWTKKDTTIVAAFSFTVESPTTIYEFDSSTLETVGAPFKAHTKLVDGLALSFDCALLASASDDTIKLWAFESRQFLASFDVQNPRTLILSPTFRQVAYTTFGPAEEKIYICNIPPDILASIWPAPSTNVPKSSRIGHPLNADAPTHPAVRRNQLSSSFGSRSRPPSTIRPRQSTLAHFLYKLFSSSSRTNRIPLVQNDAPPDPLDFPAISRLPHNTSPLAQVATHVHSELDPGENHLSFPRPRTSRHELPVVEVAPGRKFTRLAAVDIPEYRKVNDTRRSSTLQPAVSLGTADSSLPFDSSDNDSLPDVHWCKAFLCYCSCWSHGTLRIPPRWRLERVDEYH